VIENLFQQPEAALRAIERLEALTGMEITPFVEKAFVANVDADMALTNLERWLRSTGNPTPYIEQMIGLPELGKLLISMLGASQPIANTLIQNPELATLVLDPQELRRVPTKAEILTEGRLLLGNTTSYLHSLDRLRFLRQRWNFPIALNDFAGNWEQEVVWRALSDLAEVLIELSSDVAWNEYARQKGITAKPKFMIVGFGKLGGGELNYSSDVDLVYVVEDGLSEREDRDCTRFFEAFGRAVTDQMGRGSLYRVDLRLRPYGGAGPIVRSMKAYEVYYRLYAEPWEVQALLRSKTIVGTPDLVERWQSIRTEYCFKPTLSEISLEHMLAMKARIEDGATSFDLKRGEGGIRDVEFLTQIMQMIHGHDHSDLQVLSTCDALRRLGAHDILELSVVHALIEGYTFLRKLEHRIQLVGDQQTHSVPSGSTAREGLAKMMGCPGWADLELQLVEHRRTIQSLYRSTMKLERHTDDNRLAVKEQLGTLGTAALHWFDALPESAAFYGGLISNQDSLRRIKIVLEQAPTLVSNFRDSVSLTELLMSGEIEEDSDAIRRLEILPIDADETQVARSFLHARSVLLVRWLLEPAFDLGSQIAAQIDALMHYVCRRLEVSFDVIALGSYGSMEAGPSSDADLLLLIQEKTEQAKAERKAQDLLSFLGTLKRMGAPIAYDLRLRPEGGKGLLVRTYDGLKVYDFDGMEMWERFALGHARLVHGKVEAYNLVLHCALGLPLTPERLSELTKMKRRIETERVAPQHVHRDVKLGSGGISDIEWLVHLTEMRFPTASKAGTVHSMQLRIRNLVRARLINTLEGELLIEASEFLHMLRTRIFLMGIEDDLMPENPDRLDRLAASCGFTDGNSLLSRFQSVTQAVRRMYLESLERLKS